jgi:hypothetical protein
LWIGNEKPASFTPTSATAAASDKPTLKDRDAAMDDRTTVGADGPEPPPEPARADPIAGELVTETFEYDDGREVTVYVPRNPPEAVVFAGDGQLISTWGRFLEAADVPSTMIVGAHRLADETLRLQEYSPVFDAERFAAHEKFFVEEGSLHVRVRTWIIYCLDERTRDWLLNRKNVMSTTTRRGWDNV